MILERERSFGRGDPVRDYWLVHCEGFRVVRGHRTLGVVEAVGHRRDGGASALHVRPSGLRRRAHVVPAGAVEEVVPADETLVVAPHPAAERPPREPRRALATGGQAAAALGVRSLPTARATAVRATGAAHRASVLAVAAGRACARGLSAGAGAAHRHEPAARAALARAGRTAVRVAAAVLAAARTLARAVAAQTVALAGRVDERRRARAARPSDEHRPDRLPG